MKKIAWITTGGTIASVSSNSGLVPGQNAAQLKELLGSLILDTEIELIDLFTLDSSNIQPEEWKIIATKIDEIHTQCDGVVLTHGTDTMAYTASALSYMLEGIDIPVVLTGSQLPLLHPLSDGIENLRSAFAMASSKVPGVFIAFNRKIILGTRAVKVRTQGFDAFESVNQKLAGIIDSRGLTINSKVVNFPFRPYQLHSEICQDVILIKLIPGMNPRIFDSLIDLKIKGVIVEAFGVGGLSYIRRDLTAKLEMLIKHNIAVVVCSQCLYENSDFSRYEVGIKAKQKGVIEVYDMTSEAAAAKLMSTLAKSDDLKTIKTLMQTNVVNDIRVPSEE